MESKLIENKQYYSNGQLYRHEYYKDNISIGNEEGECKWWLEDGQLRLHGWYKDGKRHGEWKEWYSNGQIELHCFYNEGYLSGLYKAWQKTGQLIDELNYRNGLRQGYAKCWNYDNRNNYTRFYLFNHHDHRRFNVHQKNIWLKYLRKLRLRVFNKKYKEYFSNYMDNNLIKLCLEYY